MASPRLGTLGYRRTLSLSHPGTETRAAGPRRKVAAESSAEAELVEPVLTGKGYAIGTAIAGNASASGSARIVTLRNLRRIQAVEA